MLRAVYAGEKRVARILNNVASSDSLARCLDTSGTLGALARLLADLDARTDSAHTSAIFHGDVSRLLEALDRDLPPLPRRLGGSSRARLEHHAILAAEEDLADDPNAEALLSAVGMAFGGLPHLPGLELLADQFADRADLADTAVIAHQHLMGSNVAHLLQYLRLGVNPNHMFVFGKMYSSSDAATRCLSSRGPHVSDGWDLFDREDLLRPDEHQAWYFIRFQAQLRRCLALICERIDIRRIVILDDGGLAVNAIAQLLTSPGHLTAGQMERLKSIAICSVEQTTAGRRYVGSSRSTDAGILTVDVAGNRLKRDIEGPIIGESVVTELQACLQQLDESVNLTREPVGLIGMGVVGRAVAAALRRRKCRNIVYFDPAPTSRTGLDGDTRADSLKHLLGTAQIVIGATGTLLNLEPSWVRDGAIVASASSWNYEFWRLMQRAKRARRPSPDVAPRAAPRKFDWLHSNLRGESPTGRYLLLNSGYPVNFTGGADPIEPKRIQVTRCLMFGAAIDALDRVRTSSRTREVGLLPLSPRMESQIEAVIHASR